MSRSKQMARVGGIGKFLDDEIRRRSQRGRALARGLPIPAGLSWKEFLQQDAVIGLDFITACEMFDEYEAKR